jgi:hypothetical protein
MIILKKCRNHSLVRSNRGLFNGERYLLIRVVESELNFTALHNTRHHWLQIAQYYVLGEILVKVIVPPTGPAFDTLYGLTGVKCNEFRSGHVERGDSTHNDEMCAYILH